MIPTARARCAVAACGPVALALLASAASAQLPPPQPDCVDNQRLPIASGGTNGVKSVFAIDVDGDLDIDVLSASANDDKIAWYENDGNTPPAFTEHVVTMNADGAASVQAGDLDGDEDIDIVSASGNDNKIAWYENDGSDPPRFIERVITHSAQNAAAVHIADVDGDEDNDVVVASIGDDTIAVYENDLAQKDEGDTSVPVFTKVILSDTARDASSVFAAQIDLVDDDLEVLSASRLDDTIAWYERATIPGDGGDDIVVWVKRVIDSGADGAASVHAKDLDGDGDVDVLSASGNDNKIAWYENDGADLPSFTKHVIFAGASGASAVFAADLDGDLDVDVLSASRFDGKIAWYENLGGGNFGDPTGNRQIIAADAPGAAAVFAIDLDGDAAGDVDVLSASSVAGTIASDDRIAWHENDGQPMPAFTEREIAGGAVAPEALLAVDVDGDTTDVDVLAASSVDDTIIWFESDGMDPPSFTKHLVSADAPEALDLFWVDLDGDQDHDIVAALAGADSIAWYENLGGGDFGDPATNRKNIALLAADGASSVFAVDLDDDGDVDVLSASAGDDRIAWYESDLAQKDPGDTSPPAFTQTIISDLAEGASSVYAVDLDGDGDVDVIAASADDDRIRWFESDLNDAGMVTPPPNFKVHFVSDSANGVRDVVAADLDDDGDLDIVAAESNENRVTWYEQRVKDEVPQIAVLVSGDTVECTATYTITQADMDSGSITNTGTVTATGATDSDTLTVRLGSPSSSIDVAKSADATATTGVGDTIIYTYAVSNDGDVTLTGVSVTDPHAGLSGINCGTGTATPQIASLEPGVTVICTATYTVSQADVNAGSITNTATASGTDPLSDPVSDSDELTVTLASSSSIDIAKSSDATESMGVGDTITYTYHVTNRGDVTLSDVSVTDPQAGLSTIDCGIVFVERPIPASASRVRAVLAVDLDDVPPDGDGDIDIVSASSGDDKIAWYQSDLEQQQQADPPPDNPIPAFTVRPVSTTAESARAVAVADMNGDGALDVVTGFLFEIAWHPGNAVEICTTFDVTGDVGGGTDKQIDGSELSWLGGAFGEICADPVDPDEWWIGIDFNGDCLVDGEDLAILTAHGVWGTSTDPDQEERPVCAFTCP